jgi:VanZ family protein
VWLPPLLLMAVIFGFSAQSNPMPVVTAHVWDKLLHTCEYGGLAILFARALAGEALSVRSTIMIATLLASLYGATDEYHQRFVPERSADAADWAADTIGAAVGAVAYVLASRRGITGHARSGTH